MNPMNPPPTKGQSFVKGGIGCLLLFAVFALLSLVFGGSVHADIGGILMLFVIGGVLGLIVRAIYNRGRKDSEDKPS
jgi:hypothetical protein